jgi:molecular chaperone HscB
MANYFELFKLNIEFNIDKKKLSDEYLLLQKQYHPDKAENPKQQISFNELSASYNKAFKTLENDLERAIYILHLNNITLEDYSNNQTILENIWLDYEEFEDMSDAEDLNLFYENKIKERNELIAKLDSLFKFNLIDAGKYTMLLKYLSNLIQNIKSKMNQALT